MPVIAGTSAVGEIAEIYGGSVGGLKTPKQVWPRTPVILVSFRHTHYTLRKFFWGLALRVVRHLPHTRSFPYRMSIQSVFFALTRYVMGSKTAHAGIALPVWVSGLFSVLGKIGYGLCSQDRLWDPKIGRNFCRRSPPISAKIPPPISAKTPPPFWPKYPPDFAKLSPTFLPYPCRTFSPVKEKLNIF